MAKNSRVQIEKDKRKIIKELSRNANKSINEIANNCGFSRQKVWRIIKNLEKNNVIWGYSAVVDEEKQEQKGYLVLIKRSDAPVKKEIIMPARAYPPSDVSIIELAFWVRSIS